MDNDRQQGSLSIDGWCRRHNLSRSYFYKLERAGKAPRTFNIGRKIRRISADADDAWVAAREEETLACPAI
jgi:predicted DNA-binding transcriptional regulator AlpA